jgi:predicted Zn finger-like uncharacterized protein
MALATQCPFCQTTFLVAHDQLKLRAGLVRCGHCHEIFDGNAHLLPERPGGDNWPPLPAAPSTLTPSITPAIARANAAAPDYGKPPTAAMPDPDTMAEIEAAWNFPTWQDDAAAPEADLPLTADHAAAQASAAAEQTSAEIAVEDDPAHLEAAPELSERDGAEEAGDPVDEAVADETAADETEPPGFVRQAQRRQRWGRTGRTLTAVFCVLLLLAALAQGIYLGRNRIAAALPSTQPLLAAACLPLRCTVGLQQRIEWLSIESNELQASVPGDPALTLRLLLRNRGDTAVVWPHLELTLNDDDENALVRRVFAPADYLPARQLVKAGIAAGAEQPVALTFTLAQGTASGYRIYLFYP